MSEMLFANLPDGSPLHAAQLYWNACARMGGTNAVVWLQADDGQWVAMSRGEYAAEVRDAVMEAVEGT